MLVDSHCHLDFPDFAEDIPGVIARAEAAGVTRMLTISTRVAKAEAYRAIAEAHPQVWYTVGTHPHGAAEEPDVSAETLAGLTQHPRCVGIGEAGLDYHYEEAAPQAVQERVFRAHVTAARATGLPLVIHSRDADAHMEAVLSDEVRRGPFKAILHCFSSGARLARVGVELGLYLSFSGIVTFRRSHELREIALAVPQDRMLVETDAPFLAPEPHRGRRCEPAHTADTARSLAKTLDLPFETLAAQTTENFYRLFDKAAALEGRTA
ncbi:MULTISPECIES: TatD family hydrolase [Methylobacterium]|uniref:D-aminoacyl-tRNA deacylase n=1 Tax=Methylobacterium thuringiense TaxID=1003091 RepID=A0ABQ4TMU8_9HYPH|nr:MULTISPECIES: TatD family hydrolase [Methylobacterium]TXN19799.1 TatD family deoxyribonuclease [Methylobacterium sp. WL9]GJE56001.1 D-aminoacyl-tRNA deacylase [Methylobacterium thuringiense]